ncbi:MAG: hypothetical protein ACREO8_13705 [Luteimonas sp.]
MKLATRIAVLVASAVAAYGSAASAQTLHSAAANPAARCQAARPVFDQSLHKRPLAVQNEGTSNAFVTCSYEADSFASLNGILVLDTFFTNNSANTVQLTCVAVSGFQEGTNEYIAKTTVIEAGQQGNPSWEAVEVPSGLLDSLINISCALPPGVSINDSTVVWDEAN